MKKKTKEFPRSNILAFVCLKLTCSICIASGGRSELNMCESRTLKDFSWKVPLSLFGLIKNANKCSLQSLDVAVGRERA